MKRWVLISLLIFSLPVNSWAFTVAGSQFTYTVQKGDSLVLIKSRFGIYLDTIVALNGFDPATPLRVGQKLKLDNRKIVPKQLSDGIIINIADRTLYFFREGKLDMFFPIGLGLTQWRGRKQWRTPTGTFIVTTKEKNPTWHVPESLQEKMELEEKDVIPVIVPPGPDNPLGRFAVKTSMPGILIHETIWPTSIYNFRSHGCIRVAPEYMEPFFYKVVKHMEGEIVYRPIKVAVTENNDVLIEVHGDIYRKMKDPRSEVKRLLEELNAANRADWKKIERELSKKRGVVTDVTLRQADKSTQSVTSAEHY